LARRQHGRIVERDLAGHEPRDRLLAEPASLPAKIPGHGIERRLLRAHGAEQISREGLFQHTVASGQPALIGVNAPIKSLRHPLHLAANAEISRPHFTKGAVEIREHGIKNPLTQFRRPRCLALETVQKEKRMQADQLKSSVDRVGYADFGEKYRLARLLYDPAIGQLGGFLKGVAPEQRNHDAQAIGRGEREVDSNPPSAKVACHKWAASAPVSTETDRFNVVLRFRFQLAAGIVASGIVVAGLGACSPTVDQRGNLPDPDKLASIRPGATTKDEVVKILGTPSSTGVFDDKNWYYISRRTEQLAFFDPDVVDQQVYVVNFDDRGVVRAVDHKNLKDGREIEPAPGATPAPGRELTFLEQIIGNVGRFNKSSPTSSGTDSTTQTGRPYEPGDPNKH